MNKSGITAKKIKILIIDDEPANLDVLLGYLGEEEFDVITAIDKNAGIEKLKIISDLDLIILTQMCLYVEIVNHLKKNERYINIPIILQIDAEQTTQIAEGFQTNSCYYLVKPYNKNFFIRLIKMALHEAFFLKEIVGEMKKFAGIPNLMSQSKFCFSTINEAKMLAYFIANAFPDPDKVAYGLIELMLNAIEHGNLGITYDEKSMLLESGQWYEEINRRLALPKNKDKTAIITFKSSQEFIVVSIKDQGEGFQWQPYLELSPSRMTHPNGRGVATAKLSFTTMDYCGNGNEVVCTVLKK